MTEPLDGPRDVDPGRPSDDVAQVPFADAARVWTRVALLSFGGPAGQIAVMHRIVVDEKRYVSEQRFLHALNFCMVLPGPEAQQLATYLGWLLHGVRGGLCAGILFVLPGFLSILALSFAYALYQDTGPLQAIFFGLKPAVLAIVLEALVRIGRRVLAGRAQVVIAAAAFAALFFGAVPFPAVVIGAAMTGLLLERRGTFAAEVPRPAPPTARTSLAPLLRTFALGVALWFTPLLLLAWWLGRSHVLLDEGIFFSKTAVVTFGGAYAVLAYIGQRAVETFGWLTPGEMLDGLGLAETTPGPLIMVVQFVGFLGAYRDAAPFSPGVAGVLGSLVTTWVTFVPCFIWIFAFAPSVERLRSNRALAAALRAITAAVVGVILNLALWFAIHTLFTRTETISAGPLRMVLPDVTTLDPAAAAIALLAALALLRFKVRVLPVLLGAALLGMVVHVLA